MDKEFEPFVYYNLPGDEIEAFITSDDYYGEWINPHLTIYYKEGDEEKKDVVGLCIHFISRLIQKGDEDMKNEACHKCGHPVTEDCIRDKYCTRCGEETPEGVMSHSGHEGMSKVIQQYNGTLFDREDRDHACFYSPENGWFEHLDHDDQIMARQWADEMAERFVCSIKTRPLTEISIPKHWMIPDFADKVLSYCTETGVEYTKIKETKNQVFVTHGRPQPPKKRPVLIIVHKALRKTLCDAGEDILLHALDSSYVVYEGFDVATMRDQTRQAFDSGKNMAVILDWYKDIEILRDIVTEYNAIVLDTQCKIHRG